MVDIEQEYRYRIDDEKICKIKEIADTVETLKLQKDITFGYAGFESLYKYGYVCRVRQKGEKKWMEIKKRAGEDTFHETKLKLDNYCEGIEFFTALGMKPYMYIQKTREILSYKGLKIFIDDIELLGKFVEIEFQNVDDAKKVVDEFLNIINITTQKEPLYGDILKEKLQNDEEFKTMYEEKLKQFILDNSNK